MESPCAARLVAVVAAAALLPETPVGLITVQHGMRLSAAVVLPVDTLWTVSLVDANCFEFEAVTQVLLF